MLCAQRSHCIMKAMRVALYCRVSTKEQDDQMQVDELRALCDRLNWTVVEVYREKASGLKSADERVALRALVIAAKQRQFDKVVVWSVDRIARSIAQLVNVLAELHCSGIQLFSFKQGVDTSTPMGAAFWHILGIFSEFEHSIRKERQAAGIARAKARGVKFGRPQTSLTKRQEIIGLRSQGAGINRIAKALRVGSGTVAKIVAEQLLDVDASYNGS